MEEEIEITNIYETYKKLLTKRMQDIFELYYYDDLSLREIGENKGISYQAARDSIKKTKEQIIELEKKLGVNKLKKELEKLKKELNKNI